MPGRGSGRGMDFSVVAVARGDDSAVEEPVRVAVAADRLGYREVWTGEGPTWASRPTASPNPASAKTSL